MTPNLQRLIDALRDELQHYGEVLALLDAGHDRLTRKTVARASRAAASFQAHATALIVSRGKRERFQQQLAWACQHPDASAPEKLLPLIASEYQPLLRALFEETHSLRRQLHERAQHHPWLQANGELTARLVSPAAPEAAATPPRPSNVIVPGALSA